MFKIIVTIISTAVVVLFAVQNFDHVPVYIFWGKALNIRLIFVVAIAGVGGYLVRLFIGIGREERLKRQVHTLLRRHRSMKKRTNEFDEEL